SEGASANTSWHDAGGPPVPVTLRPGDLPGVERRPVVIRFCCPQCGNMLNVPGARGGTPVVCPRCQGRSVAPAGGGRPQRAEGACRQGVRHPDQAQGPLSGMNWQTRAAVAGVAGVATLSLLLPVLSPLLPAHGGVADSAPHWSVILVPCSALLLLVILYGQGTGCPSCHKWWARTRVETEFVDRGVVARGGVPCGRSRFST